MLRTSLLADDLPESDLPLADMLKRFADKEKQRRARQIVQRRAKHLNEVREEVLRRRAEKGQPMDTIEEKAQKAGIQVRDDWETKNGELTIAALAFGLGVKGGAEISEKNVKDNTPQDNEEKDRESTACSGPAVVNLRRARARHETCLKRRGRGLISIPRDFSPLADIPEKDLGRVYAEPNYATRFKLYKEAARRACGLKVWTWEELIDGKTRPLRETCRMPTAERRSRRVSVGATKKPNTSSDVGSNAATSTSAITDGSNKYSKSSVSRKADSRPFKFPRGVSRDIVRSIHQEIQDEKREQELKFLELEMKMTPYVVDAGLFDSDPEFTEELNVSITQARVRQKLFEESKQQKKPERTKTHNNTSKAAALSGKHAQITASCKHIPTATARRAIQREEYEAIRREKLEALEYDPYEDDSLFQGLDCMLSYDPRTKQFLPPQATLIRARDRMQEAKDRERYKQRLQERLQEKRLALARAARRIPPRPPGRRGVRPRRNRCSRNTSQSPTSRTPVECQRTFHSKSSSEESLKSVKKRGTSQSAVSSCSSSSFRKPGYYYGDNMSSGSSSLSLVSIRPRSLSVDSVITGHPGITTPRSITASDSDISRISPGRCKTLRAAIKVLARDTGSGGEQPNVSVFNIRRGNKYDGSSSEEEYIRNRSPRRIYRNKSAFPWLRNRRDKGALKILG